MYKPAIMEPELAPYFTTKAPFQFPINFREGFVKYWPIVSLVLILISLPGILAFLGIGAALVPASLMVVGGFGYTIAMVLLLLSLLLRILALSGLFNRKRSGWVYSYYAQIVGIVSSIFSFSILGILFGLLFLMLLFQVREYYT